eukprot:TRINITY_DN6000_c0_g1_i1.p2 TRINITY_DN6000_c0_g1~~TRINITY_DN6000_c0_g1_i1.p2  ORF type:complete len:52 (-),score=6.86 TRINITY_DN6000_c0_g1_i1:92-247(-)
MYPILPLNHFDMYLISKKHGVVFYCGRTNLDFDPFMMMHISMVFALYTKIC